MPATVFTYTFGIIASMVFGIVIGIIGFIAMGVNYPIYKRLLENYFSIFSIR